MKFIRPAPPFAGLPKGPIAVQAPFNDFGIPAAI